MKIDDVEPLIALRRLERRVLWGGAFAVMLLLGVDVYHDARIRALHDLVTPRTVAMARLDAIDEAQAKILTRVARIDSVLTARDPR